MIVYNYNPEIEGYVKFHTVGEIQNFKLWKSNKIDTYDAKIGALIFGQKLLKMAIVYGQDRHDLQNKEKSGLCVKLSGAVVHRFSPTFKSRFWKKITWCLL